MAVKPLPLLKRLNIQVNVVSVLMYCTHTGQLSTESQFEELKNELKSIMSNLNDTMAEIQTIKRQIESTKGRIKGYCVDTAELVCSDTLLLFMI